MIEFGIIVLVLLSVLVSVQLCGPIWHDPMHDTAFVDKLLASAHKGNQYGGLGEHPVTLPDTDTGSNPKEIVLRSRERMVEILKACKSEVRAAHSHAAAAVFLWLPSLVTQASCLRCSCPMRLCTLRRRTLHPSSSARTSPTSPSSAPC